MTFQLRVKAARRFAGLSQAQLGNVLGVQRSAVSHWESRIDHRPSTSRLEELAKVTGVNFEWLATGRGRMALSGEAVLEGVPTAQALLVEDAAELRLIRAFRTSSLRAKLALLELAEELAEGRPGKRVRPTVVAALLQA